MRNPNPTKHTNLELDTVTTFHPMSGFVFEDNETVIKMRIKSRSPTMRHVSRTHRVALDWLFDRINFDSEIQIRYIDSKHSTRREIDQRKFHT